MRKLSIFADIIYVFHVGFGNYQHINIQKQTR